MARCCAVTHGRRSNSTRSPHHPSRVCDRTHTGGLRRRVGSPGLRFLVADSTNGDHRRRPKTADRGCHAGEHADVDERRPASRFRFDHRPGLGLGSGTRSRRTAPPRTNGHDARHRPRRRARRAHGRDVNTLGPRRRDGARVQRHRSSRRRNPRPSGNHDQLALSQCRRRERGLVGTRACEERRHHRNHSVDQRRCRQHVGACHARGAAGFPGRAASAVGAARETTGGSQPAADRAGDGVGDGDAGLGEPGSRHTRRPHTAWRRTPRATRSRARPRFGPR